VANKGGRPKLEFTRDQLDDARDLLGRRVYSSRVAKELRDKYRDLSVHASYELIAAAQREVYDAIRGGGKADDPLTAQYVFLMAVIADPAAKHRDKIAASAVIIRLFGLNKLIDALGETDAENLLAEMVARKAARTAPATNGAPHR
jgi:hypothetical protein